MTDIWATDGLLDRLLDHIVLGMAVLLSPLWLPIAALGYVILKISAIIKAAKEASE